MPELRRAHPLLGSLPNRLEVARKRCEYGTLSTSVCF